jgi:hypothetical protein
LEYIKKKDSLFKGLAESLFDVLYADSLPFPIHNSATGEIIVRKGQKISNPQLMELARTYQYLDMVPGSVRTKVEEIGASFTPKFDALERECSCMLSAISGIPAEEYQRSFGAPEQIGVTL